MAKNTYRSISLKYSAFIHKEVKSAAATAILPGHLISINASGELIVHGSAGGYAVPSFAVEADIQGNDVTKVYVAGEVVHLRGFAAGSEVAARITENTAAIVLGDLLESAGTGMLRKVTTGIPIARALDTAGGGASGTVYDLVRVEVL